MRGFGPRFILAGILIFLAVGLGVYFYSQDRRTESPPGLSYTKTIGERAGDLEIEKIDSDSVDGNLERRFPTPTVASTTIHVGAEVGDPCTGTSTIVSEINFSAQTVTFTETHIPHSIGICPQG